MSFSVVLSEDLYARVSALACEQYEDRSLWCDLIAAPASPGELVEVAARSNDLYETTRLLQFLRDGNEVAADGLYSTIKARLLSKADIPFGGL